MDNQPGEPHSKGCFDPASGKPLHNRPQPRQVVAQVIGDSHADADVTAVVAALPPHSSLVWSDYHACPPLIDGVSTDPESRCDAFLRHDLLPLNRPRTMPVILISTGTVLDPVLYICPNEHTCMGSIHRRAIFRDMHHMTEFGNKLLTPIFQKLFASRSYGNTIL